MVELHFKYTIKPICITFQTVDLEICSFFFYFLRKGLGLACPLHFMYGFSRKIFLLWYSINWTKLVWLPLLLGMLGNYCNYLFLVCDVINFEINPSFLIKPFFHKAKNLGKKLNIENEKRFYVKKLFSSRLSLPLK